MKNAATQTIVTFAVGHLLHQAEPDQYGEQFGKPWKLDVLPVLPSPWRYLPDPKTAKQLAVVTRLLRTANELVIATDADREGEVIARNIVSHVGYTGLMSRLWVSDSTATGIKKALGQIKPAASTQGLYASGVGRQRADWVAGMNLTRALTVAFGGRGTVINFGRVQTPTLALVVRRERAIGQFIPSPYFSLQAHFKLGSHAEAIAMRWLPETGQVDANNRLVDAAIAKAIVGKVTGQKGTVDAVDREQKQEAAPLLYDLGALQRECSSRFGMSPDKTLATVQSLYETHKLLTYPRTDCEYIAEEMYPDAPRVLAAIGGVHPELSKVVASIVAQPLRAPTRAFNSKRVAASAHHAIIPTSASQMKLDALKPNEQQVYNLVARRYLAQFLPNHGYDETRVSVTCAGVRFIAIGRVVTEPGWKLLYPPTSIDEKKPKRTSKTDADDDEKSSDAVDLPAVSCGDAAINTDIRAVSKLTQPPKRYTEATLLSAMEAIDKEIDDPRLAAIMKNKEKAGIGTSATRGEILKRLFAGEYFELDKKAVKPTSKGLSVVELMERVCPQLVDLAMTAIWESALTEVENGALSLDAFESKINQFVTQAITQVRTAASSANVQRIGLSADSPVSPSGNVRSRPNANDSVAAVKHACPSCAAPMRRRSGSRGEFWGCSAYPKCSMTLPDVDGTPGAAQARAKPQAPNAPRGEVGNACPTCSLGKLTQRSTSDGRPFLGCTKFPACKHFEWIPSK